MAKKSKMMAGSPILQGDNTIPGLKIHKEVFDVIPKIEEACKKMGLDYYPIIVEFVRYDEMAELASYGGFPVRYPHWKFGMEYEEMSLGYEHNQYRISEMVINTSPCHIYCMDSNTLGGNINVIAHAIGHNDFFKNNVFFEKTDRNMLNKLANHGTRIRKYISRWGYEVVTEFIDDVMKIETLIDPRNAWKKKRVNNSVIRDERNYRFPERLRSSNEYMDEWVNADKFINNQKERILEQETSEMLDIFSGPEKDIFGYIKDNAPLKPWQQDVVDILYEEMLYFYPQMQTKTLNEGWASYVDFHLMCKEGLVSLGQSEPHGNGIWEYADHKSKVLGGKYSLNPYKIGFELLKDIEDRWNKGKFGREYENCQDMREKENWNKNLGLGREKIFEVRRCHNDYTLIREFFTPEFCEKNEFFEWALFPNGEYKIVNRDFKSIKEKMLDRHLNAGLPDIRLEDPNHLGKGWFFMQHFWDGRPLDQKYVNLTIVALYKLWKKNIVLASKISDKQEIVYVCFGPNPQEDVKLMTRQEYENQYMS